MRFPATLIPVLACFLCVATAARGVPPAAAEVFADGQRFLKAGEFDAALKAFKSATQAAPEAQEYAQQYVLLRQIVRLRTSLTQDTDDDRWLSAAGALRTFYYDQQLYSEALALDVERHTRARSSGSGAMLAETYLALGEYSQAVEVLAGLKPEEVSARTSVLWGLALAHQGRVAEARVIASDVPDTPEGAGSRQLYERACLFALVGDATRAGDTLRRCFEATPPSRIDGLRTEARAFVPFGQLWSSAELDNVLATASKVQESKCSKGAGCGKCPKRAKCGSHPAKVEKGKP